ncbi:GNAT family N-acetyltransferase [Hirschia litorea]|uniref:GNAT family N-acetyltransferase n=1 Tax=Hirschia litorea TaxID=1199156 RepID=A0ABW2IGP5_9PROT
MTQPNSNLLDQVRIRSARADEINALQEIDLTSSQLFRETGLLDFSPDSAQLRPIPEARFRNGLGDSLLWVSANDRDIPIGFILCEHKKTGMYLDQVSVLPEYGRKGIGEQLVRHAIEETKRHGYDHISLSTFRDIPWNGKFYKRLGFKEIPRHKLQDWQHELTQLQRATMDISKRCFMKKSVKRLFF